MDGWMDEVEVGCEGGARWCKEAKGRGWGGLGVP